MDAILSLPFGLAVAILFVIVLLRTNATYWAGRGAAAGLDRSQRVADWAHGPRMARALERAGRLIERWGPPAVALAYLTIGLQTAIHLAAGMARMRLRHYLPAAVAGSIAWALLYATVGLAAIELWVDSALVSPWLWIPLVGAVLVVVVRAVLVRRARRRARRRVGRGGQPERSGADASVDTALQGRRPDERSGT